MDHGRCRGQRILRSLERCGQSELWLRPILIRPCERWCAWVPIRRLRRLSMEAPVSVRCCSSTQGGCHATPIPCSLAQASVRDIDTFAQAQIGPGRFASSHAIEVTPTEIEGMVLGFRVPGYLGKSVTVPGLRWTRMNHKTRAEGCTTKSSRPRWSSNHLSLRGDSWPYTIGARSWRQTISDK